jgi:hypothetical protein
MPGRLTNTEVIDAIEVILRSGVLSIKLSDLSREDAISWRDCFELEGDRYSVCMREPSKANSYYSIEIKPKRS